MTTLADGPLIIPVNQLRQMLADCYWWRRLEDPDAAWGDATALAHTHIDAVDSPQNEKSYTFAELAALRPLAIVYQANGDGFELISQTLQSRCHVAKGHLIIDLQINTPSDLSNDESALGEYLHKAIGKLIQTADSDKPGLLDLTDRMPIYRIVVDPYQRVPEKERETLGDVIVCEIHVYWGRQ